MGLAGILRPLQDASMTLPTLDDNGFRIRGGPTRTDAFVDAAFAFAVTLLVISIGHVPAFNDATTASESTIASREKFRITPPRRMLSRRPAFTSLSVAFVSGT